MGFLAKSNLEHIGILLSELKNSYTRGVDGYPLTLTLAFDMIMNYKDPSKYHAPACDANEDRMSFFNNQDEQDEQHTPQGHGHSGRGGAGQGGHGGHGCSNGGGCIRTWRAW